MNAALGTASNGQILDQPLNIQQREVLVDRWAPISGKKRMCLCRMMMRAAFVTAADYALHVTPDTRVATILHTLACHRHGYGCGRYCQKHSGGGPRLFYHRRRDPACCAWANSDIANYDIDGYVISPYKMFSRHGYGLAWISPRMAALPHDNLVGGPAEAWELGTVIPAPI